MEQMVTRVKFGMIKIKHVSEATDNMETGTAVAVDC